MEAWPKPITGSELWPGEFLANVFEAMCWQIHYFLFTSPANKHGYPNASSVCHTRVWGYGIADNDVEIYIMALECAFCAYFMLSCLPAWHFSRRESKDKHQNQSRGFVIMSLSIELNSGSEKPRIFSQGELVSGKVIFNCSRSEDVAAIIIR